MRTRSSTSVPSRFPFPGPSLTVSLLLATVTALPAGVPGGEDVGELARELASQGWIVFTARTEKGDLDLFRARPNGTELENLTETPSLNEFGARFSPDGRRMMWRQAGLEEEINHDNWGSVGALVTADSRGRDPKVLAAAGNLLWASWGPDGKRIACLDRSQGRVQIYDVATEIRPLQELPAHGIFQQLFWSPDGRFLVGTASVAGRNWNILVQDIVDGDHQIISRALNCTPDWFPDSRACLYSHRNPNIGSDDQGQHSASVGETPDYSWTLLLRADREGKKRDLLVGEQFRHLYFGAASPDGKYLIYSRLESDNEMLGPMAVVRLADTPIIDGQWRLLQRRYRDSRPGPVLQLDLPPGFEPEWVYADFR